MILRNIFILIFTIFVVSGCCQLKNSDGLNSSHIPAEITGNLIIEKSWSLDKKSFLLADKVEICSFGGDDPFSKDSKEPMRGNFSKLLENNSYNLMSSIFGNKQSDKEERESKMLLRVKFIGINTKAAYLAWQNSETTIDLEFTLINLVDNKENVVKQLIVSKTASGDNGTGCTFHSNAHERANRSINEAFVEARKLFVEAIK